MWVFLAYEQLYTYFCPPLYYLAVYEINVSYIVAYNVGVRVAAESEAAGEATGDLNIIFPNKDKICMSK